MTRHRQQDFADLATVREQFPTARISVNQQLLADKVSPLPKTFLGLRCQSIRIERPHPGQNEMKQTVGSYLRSCLRVMSNEPTYEKISILPVE